MDETPHTEVPSIDPSRMRSVLGHFASGIVVITAVTPAGPAGFTCQSFSSLSLDPPLVSFCPARTSTTWPRIRETGSFCVNVLADAHRELSSAFARSGTDKFAGVTWDRAPSGAPVLADTAAWIDCTLEEEHPGGDHTIVVARVRDLGADPQRAPLLFHRGGYVVLAPQGCS
ncbi:flavin reductase family protein [Pseudonocardia sp.]|jgi:flavin reductase (DIM6/NTAB) family NADH-FMN oxidoreductase RutF|uniref:flavin reductase family protein n=1 Tax=Pseudonocardia sp. TaxID=60912 RepID=UPI003D12B4DD